MERPVDSEEVAGSSSKERFPYSKRLFYGIGHVLNDLCASMWFSYLLIYYHSVISFSNSMAGNVLLLGQLADAVCTPLIGLESDRVSGIKNYGKRKSWHLVGTICVALSFAFIFNPCITCNGANDWAKLIYYAPFVVIFQFGWAATQINHLALIPELTKDESIRVELNAIRYSFTVIANICVFVLAWIFLETQDNDKLSVADVPGFRYLAFLVVGIGCIFQGLFHAGTKERAGKSTQYCKSEANRLANGSIADGSDKMIWKNWLREPQFYMIGFLYMCTRLIVNISQAYLPFYLIDTMELEKTYIAFIPLITYVSGFVSSLLMKKINKLVGRKMTYFFFGLLPIILTCITFWFYHWVKANQLIYVLAILLGFGCSTILVTSLSMTADLIKENTESGAFVYGCMSFLDKLANGVAVATIQYLHPCHNCCIHCQYYYQRVVSLIPGGFSLLAALDLLLLATQNIGVRRRDKCLRDLSSNSSDASDCDLDEEDDKVSETSPLLTCKENKANYETSPLVTCKENYGVQ